MSQDINVLALVKGNERYIFLFDDASRAEALRTFGAICLKSGTQFYLVRCGRAEPENSPGDGRSSGTFAPTAVRFAAPFGY